SPGVHERRPRADAELGGVHLGDHPSRYSLDRYWPDGGGAVARHDLLAGDAADHPAADVPARRAATHERRHRTSERLVTGVGHRAHRARAHWPGARQSLRRAADDLAARRPALTASDVR